MHCSIIICIFGPPKLLIVDKDSALTSTVIRYILEAIGCQLHVISSYNHGSLKTERQIQIIGNIINKQLVGKGEMWPLYAATAAYAANTFASETLAGYCPYELVFGRSAPDLTNFSLPKYDH